MLQVQGEPCRGDVLFPAVDHADVQRGLERQARVGLDEIERQRGWLDDDRRQGGVPYRQRLERQLPVGQGDIVLAGPAAKAKAPPCNAMPVKPVVVGAWSSVKLSSRPENSLAPASRSNLQSRFIPENDSGSIPDKRHRGQFIRAFELLSIADAGRARQRRYALGRGEPCVDMRRCLKLEPGRHHGRPEVAGGQPSERKGAVVGMFHDVDLRVSAPGIESVRRERAVDVNTPRSNEINSVTIE